jgi:hypothetical protein
MAEHGDKLDMDVLNCMDTLHLNIQEALRMNPPLIMVMRLAKEAFPVTTSDGKTYVVPKVWRGLLRPSEPHSLVSFAAGSMPLAAAYAASASPRCRATSLLPALPSPTACPTSLPTQTNTSPTATCPPVRRTSPCPFHTLASAAGVTAAWWVGMCVVGAPATLMHAHSSTQQCLTSRMLRILFCHACIPQGQNFAYLQIKTIWSVLLRNFEFELLDPVPEADYTSMVIMPKPCRVRYRRKKLAT